MVLESQQHPLSFFYASLADMKQVVDELREMYGDRHAAIIETMRAGGDVGDEVREVIGEAIHNKGDGVDVLTGYELGSWDDGVPDFETEFPIFIMRFGPVFWIAAQEHDDVGYFASMKDAVAAANLEYEQFIDPK
jgi:hypothetical protein